MYSLQDTIFWFKGELVITRKMRVIDLIRIPMSDPRREVVSGRILESGDDRSGYWRRVLCLRKRGSKQTRAKLFLDPFPPPLIRVYVPPVAKLGNSADFADARSGKFTAVSNSRHGPRMSFSPQPPYRGPKFDPHACVRCKRVRI